MLSIEDEVLAFDIEENLDESAKEFTCVATDQTTTTKILQTLHVNKNYGKPNTTN